MKHLLAGLAVVGIVAASAECDAGFCPGGCEETDAEKSPASHVVAQSPPVEPQNPPPEYPRHMFEFGVRGGLGYWVGGAFCPGGGCQGADIAGSPNIGFDTYLRIGTDNTRWQNQVSMVFMPAAHASVTSLCGSYNCGEYGDYSSSEVTIPLVVQAMLTTGFEVNTNPRGQSAFLWELGFTAGGFVGVSGSASGGLAGLKMGLGLLFDRQWEVSWQFIAGNVMSAQLLVGYDVQWGR